MAAAGGRSCNIDNNTGPEADDQPCFQITKIAHVDHGELGSWRSGDRISLVISAQSSSSSETRQSNNK